jgi:bifunctional non-homologous end joining protein LigD
VKIKQEDEFAIGGFIERPAQCDKRAEEISSPEARVMTSTIRHSAYQKKPTDAISHPEKVFWPDEGYTKLDLANFYQAVFPKLRPYVRDRILSLERCPDGMLGECFYQKEIPKGMPPGTPSQRIRHAGASTKSTNYVVGGSLTTQLALVNLGCIAVHIANSRVISLRQPDWVCFDFDPESEQFSDAARASLYVQEALEALHLIAFAKTSGSRGIHMLVPIRVGPTTDEVLSFATAVCARVAAAYPKELTVEHSIAARGGRVYLDPFRNGFVQTVVAPFSVRRRPRAPVSTPLHWSELRSPLNPADFNMGNFTQWLKRPDPWKNFFQCRQPLKDAAKSLHKL